MTPPPPVVVMIHELSRVISCMLLSELVEGAGYSARDAV